MIRFLLICFFIALSSLARGADFLPNFEDIPLMDNVAIVEQNGFIFSVPEGKISEVFVSSDSVSRRQFQKFYEETLKELGWNLIDSGRKEQVFQRNDEKLKIQILETSPLTARFSSF